MLTGLESIDDAREVIILDDSLKGFSKTLEGTFKLKWMKEPDIFDLKYICLVSEWDLIFHSSSLMEKEYQHLNINWKKALSCKTYSIFHFDSNNHLKPLIQ